MLDAGTNRFSNSIIGRWILTMVIRSNTVGEAFLLDSANVSVRTDAALETGVRCPN